jgi:hypothetical protein
MYSSKMRIVFPKDLDAIKCDADYHIYMINRIPKIVFEPHSVKQYQDHFSVKVKLKRENKIDKEIKVNIPGLPRTNNFLVHYTFDKPCKTMFLVNNNGGKAIIQALPLYLEKSIEPLETEIIYIGKAFGKKGERTALERLKSHSTLQHIQSEAIFNDWDEDIVLTLWELSPVLLTMADGTAESYQKSDEEDSNHLQRVISNTIEMKQMINISEAALIYYFKPEYNEKFKNNFPNVKHKGYQSYYDLDYNSVSVELDTSELNIHLFSENNAYHLYDNINFNLYPKDKRKSMFEIFERPINNMN